MVGAGCAGGRRLLAPCAGHWRLEPPSAVTVKWSPACAVLGVPVCSDQGENISPARRPPDGEDGIHYTLYSQFILYIIMVRETTPTINTIIIINCTGNKVKGY